MAPIETWRNGERNNSCYDSADIDFKSMRYCDIQIMSYLIFASMLRSFYNAFKLLKNRLRLYNESGGKRLAPHLVG
jgi:hypothetical protein